ncbi:hypothetical protein N657DRAFT_556952, partial [Parathielavia appendiculata]
FGGHILLLEIRRCCYNCLRNTSGLRVVGIANFANYTGLPQAWLCEHLPDVHAIPGTYSEPQ